MNEVPKRKPSSNSLKALVPILMLILASIACVQDCMGVTFGVKGYVVDEYNNPISNAKIKAWNNGSFEKPAFELNVSSDSEGYFNSDSVFSYGCSPFQVEVSAQGYSSQTLTFYPPSEGFEDELPPIITVQLDAISE